MWAGKIGGMFKSPRGHEMRKGRVSIEGQVYLVTTVTRERRPLFGEFGSGCCASRALTEPESWPEANCLAWVLMPDHLHLLIELGPREGLSLAVGRIKARIGMALKRECGLAAIWQHGYHDHALRCDESVLDAARYLIANPVRAGLASSPGGYPFWDAIWLSPDSDPSNS